MASNKFFFEINQPQTNLYYSDILLQHQQPSAMSFSIVFIGSVDSGKSTLINSLLYPNQSIDKIAQLTKLRRSRQIDDPVTPSYSLLKQNNLNITIIDVKGHRAFIKNSTTGISQADYAILVAPATLGQFYGGFSNGVIKDYIIIAYTMGIRKLIVCINKMDDTQVGYQQKCYDQVKQQLQRFVKTVGFNMKCVEFIPTSAINYDNIFKKSDNMQWYKGPTVIQAINKLQIPKRLEKKPLRISVSDHYKIGGIGFIVIGRVQSGVVTNKTKLITAQGSHKSETKSIQIFHESVNEGKAGDIVGLNVALNKNEVKRGFVIGDEQNEPPKQVQCFVARISVLTNHRIKNGYIPIVDCGTAHVACQLHQIRATVNIKTQNLIEDFPSSISKGDYAIVQMKPIKPFSCEIYQSYPQLGRIILRDGNSVVAVGIVKQVKQKQ